MQPVVTVTCLLANSFLEKPSWSLWRELLYFTALKIVFKLLIISSYFHVDTKWITSFSLFECYSYCLEKDCAGQHSSFYEFLLLTRPLSHFASCVMPGFVYLSMFSYMLGKRLCFSKEVFSLILTFIYKPSSALLSVFIISLNGFAWQACVSIARTETENNKVTQLSKYFLTGSHLNGIAPSEILSML